jgi:plastocyanin
MESKQHSHGGFALFVASIALMIAFAALIAAVKSNGAGPDAQVPAVSQKESKGTAAGEAGKAVTLTIKSDEEHAKMGPEGTWHDAYLPASFTVPAGATVTVTVHNYDDSQHTFTDPGLGVEQMIAAGSETEPSTTTFTFTAPQKAGRYAWHCMMPCDPWAMSHVGFMKGIVTVA